MDIYPTLLKYNRYPEISPWFAHQIENQINRGVYITDPLILINKIVSELKQYRVENKISKVFIGISGGLDSAVTAALFQRAGFFVHGILLPIEQNPEETIRGLELCQALEIDYRHIDLTKIYESVLKDFKNIDPFIQLNTEREAKRRGNLKARLRMMTLYNLASNYGGLVGSTDNFSELAAGFWTLHGDVGDVAPIQGLTKSWEIPLIAAELNIPNNIVTAVPTDGLGISESDETQLGVSYLEFDTVLLDLIEGFELNQGKMSTTDLMKFSIINQRLTSTKFKRNNPYNIPHPLFSDRFQLLQDFDKSSNSNISNIRDYQLSAA